MPCLKDYVEVIWRLPIKLGLFLNQDGRPCSEYSLYLGSVGNKGIYYSGIEKEPYGDCIP